MNRRLVFKYVGFILMLEGGAMLLPLIVSLIYREDDIPAFVISALLTGFCGFLMYIFTRHEKGTLYAREAFTIVGVVWSALAVFGALPLYMSGVPVSFVDCIFESFSGFTTSGASIFTDMEVLPNGVLFWRSLMHWMGGMGVLVLFLALLPNMGGRTQSLLKAEASGPTTGKIVPRIADTVKVMYLIYSTMTLAQTAALIIAGIPLFDSINIAFSTAATGGFAVTNLSIGSYGNAAAEIIIAVFMLLFSVSFTLFHATVAKKWGLIKDNTELKWFAAIVAASVVLIWMNTGAGQSMSDGFRISFFHVASVISSTGFFTVDYNLWPDFSRFLLVGLMFVGACGGSTGGGIKVARIVILVKSIHREIKKILHPRSTPIVRMNGKAVPDNVTATVALFFASYVLITGAAALIISLDGLDFVTTLTAAISAVGNTGVGLGLVGPSGSYAAFSPLSKIVLSVCMLVGRLEIFPILVIMSPSAWRAK